MIRHILLIKFKQGTTQADIERLKQLFVDMPNKVKGVEAVEWGINNSPEEKNQGFTHSVLMTFINEEAREYYLPHSEHNVLKEMFRPLLAELIVFDYTA